MTTTEKVINSESDQIERAKLDAVAFEPLYNKYYKPIFLFILNRLGDRDSSADLTSQVFLKALQNLKRYQVRSVPFSAWLYRIAINEVNDLFRREKRQRFVTLEEAQLLRLHNELTESISVVELECQLQEMLQHISTAELHLIELRYFEERSFKEIGTILNISEVYAKVKLYRIVEKLRKLFKQKDEK